MTIAKNLANTLTKTNQEDWLKKVQKKSCYCYIEYNPKRKYHIFGDFSILEITIKGRELTAVEIDNSPAI